MRLKPAVNGSVRVAERETTLADGRYRIPAGTALWTPIHTVHHSRRLWGPDGGEYKPVSCSVLRRYSGEAGSVVMAAPRTRVMALLL